LSPARFGRRLQVAGTALAAWLLAVSASAQTPAPSPKPAPVVPAFQDPADLPFRRAPMAQSGRSIVVPLGTNLHLAFDAQLLRTHTVWQGGSLNLYGPPYNGTSTRFVCDFTGTRFWGNLQRSPWIFDAVAADTPGPLTRFAGHSTAGGATSFVYELFPPGDPAVSVIESPRLERVGAHDVLIRRFEVSPVARRLRFNAHDEAGDPVNIFGVAGANGLRTPAGVLVAVLRGLPGGNFLPVVSSASVMEILNTERDGKGPWSALATNVVTGRKVSLRVAIPPNEQPQTFEVAAAVVADLNAASALAKQLVGAVKPLPAPAKATNAAPVFLPDPNFTDKPAGDEFYTVEHFPVPKDIKLTVAGMDFLPDGNLAIATFQGEVFIVEGVTGDAKAAKWRRFARGLNEPGGLRVVDGAIYVMQKCELTRLRDADGDGVADVFECVSDAWGYTGNYHSFATGPLVDESGILGALITGHRGMTNVPAMGWCLKISPHPDNSGEVPFTDLWRTDPFCSGLRVPNGFGEFRGDLFMTDNQGHWIAANKLNHLQFTNYYGHPSSWPLTRAPSAAEAALAARHFAGDPAFTPPAVWFPYAWVRSASGIATVGDFRFGPFGGQMLVGEFQNASVVRVALEKVNGQWQGAVLPFVKGFASGVNRLAYGPDSRLYVGGLRFGHWTSIAPQPHSLDRVKFTGKVPFEFKAIAARTNGFEVAFTQPVDAALAGDAENWDAQQYTYAYDGKHNAPEKDRDEKIPGPPVRVLKAEVTPDKLTVRLTLEGQKPRHVVMLRALGLKNHRGDALRNDTLHYTLNQVPK
jgi:glucose/arabinose dehydrogenase